jgi:hypothetical protein
MVSQLLGRKGVRLFFRETFDEYQFDPVWIKEYIKKMELRYPKVTFEFIMDKKARRWARQQRKLEKSERNKEKVKDETDDDTKDEAKIDQVGIKSQDTEDEVENDDTIYDKDDNE